jgi:hypothetical protein
MARLSPRDRAEQALTIHAHGGAFKFSGLAVAGLDFDLGQRVADAIADAEDEAVKDALEAVHSPHCPICGGACEWCASGGRK